MQRLRRLKKLLKLFWRQRRVLLYAYLSLNGIRLALWLFPFKVVRQQLTTLSVKWGTRSPQPPISVGAIVWAITATSSFAPRGAKCLVKALTAQLLLSRYGHPHQVHIGVAMDATQTLEAHAWVEYEDRVIMGDLNDLSRFKPLSATGVKI